jgi:hypothetical protein
MRDNHKFHQECNTTLARYFVAVSAANIAVQVAKILLKKEKRIANFKPLSVV